MRISGLPFGEKEGRGVASGYWFNGGGESSASVQVNEGRTVIIATGSPDIGGLRASMALMAAETLGIDYHQIRSISSPRGSGAAIPAACANSRSKRGT